MARKTTTKRTGTSTRRRSTTAKKATNWGESILAYLIVAICVYACFIYDPQSDPLEGATYAERLRAERHAYTNNTDIYDYQNRNDVRAYNRQRSAGSPNYYNSRNGGYADRGSGRRYSSSIYRD